MLLLVNAFWVSESTRSLGWKRDLRTKPLSDDDVYFFFSFSNSKGKEILPCPPPRWLRGSQKPPKYLCCSRSINEETNRCFIVWAGLVWFLYLSL